MISELMKIFERINMYDGFTCCAKEGHAQGRFLSYRRFFKGTQRVIEDFRCWGRSGEISELWMIF